MDAANARAARQEKGREGIDIVAEAAAATGDDIGMNEEAAPSPKRAKVGRKKWAPPKKAKLAKADSPPFPANKRIAILVPTTHQEPPTDDWCSIGRQEYDLEAQAANMVIEGFEAASTEGTTQFQGNFDMVKACVSNLRLLPPLFGVEEQPHTEPHFFHFVQGTQNRQHIDEHNVQVHRLHRSLAIYVAHLALALKIDMDKVQDSFIFVSCKTLGLLHQAHAKWTAANAADKEDLRKTVSQGIDALRNVFAKCPIYVLHGDEAWSALGRDAIDQDVMAEEPNTYPPPLVAKLSCLPSRQADFMQQLWGECNISHEHASLHPACLLSSDPQELKWCLRKADPHDDCQSYLIGYYSGDGPAPASGAPRAWVYDYVARNGSETALVGKWRTDQEGISDESEVVSLLSDGDTAASAGESGIVRRYSRAAEAIVYPLPNDAFIERKPPLFGRVFFVSEQTTNKGPQKLHLEFPPPNHIKEQLNDRTEWWAPPKKKKKCKGKAGPPSHLRELCQAISKVLQRRGVCITSQVFRVDFVYSSWKNWFLPLAVMAAAVPDDSAIPLRVHMESAHATAKLVTAFFHDKGAPWPR